MEGRCNTYFIIFDMETSIKILGGNLYEKIVGMLSRIGYAFFGL